jgi:Cof subfamily protein (haloacid dehalogenase superfamily)
MSLYVSDLDGTLLNSQAELSLVSRNLLKEMILDGLSFTVASARSINAIRQIFNGLKLRLPVIEFNGAFISDLATGRHEIVNAIDSAITGDLYDLMVKNGHPPFLSTFNGNEDHLYYPVPINDGARWYIQDRKSKGDPRLRKFENLVTSLNEEVVCLTSIGKMKDLTELASLIQADYGNQIELHLFENIYSPGWYWLMVQDYRATKDQAISILMSNSGLTDRPLVVFGDNLNDLKMFSIANEAIAVGNAVTNLKEKATKIIGSNDDDSVAKFIYEHRQDTRERKL